MSAGTAANVVTGLMNAVVSEVVVAQEAADVGTPVKHLEGTDQEPHPEEGTVMNAENQIDVNDATVVTEAALAEAMTEVMGAHVNSERACASTAEKRATSE